MYKIYQLERLSEITTLREEEQKLLGLRDEGSTFIYNKAPI